MSDIKALEIKDLHAGYGETEILKGINLSVEPAETVAIIGPNGAGKSTVVKSILGLLNVISGDILLNGKDIVGVAPDKAIKQGISYVPQTHNIFPNLTIIENLEMGAWTRSSGISERIPRGSRKIIKVDSWILNPVSTCLVRTASIFANMNT